MGSRGDVPGAAAPGTAGVLVSARGISKRYGELEVLRSVDLEMRQGSSQAIVGPSGCGKTTLLEIIAGLRNADQGTVTFPGTGVERPRMAVVFQHDSTLPWRTALQNVALPLELQGVGKSERRRRAADALAMVGLGDFLDARPRELSGGMVQRVAVARALVEEPRIILMDEPFGALDEQTRLQLGLEMTRLVESAGVTVLLVTHSIQEAVLLSDRVVVLARAPGVVFREVEVPVERPRTVETLGTPAFAAAVAEIWSCLQAITSGAVPVSVPGSAQ